MKVGDCVKIIKPQSSVKRVQDMLHHYGMIVKRNRLIDTDTSYLVRLIDGQEAAFFPEEFEMVDLLEYQVACVMEK